MSVAEEDDVKVVPDEADDTQVESSKPEGAVSTADKGVQKTTDNGGGGHSLKSADKNQPIIPATRVPPGQEIALSVMIEASSLRDAKTNNYKTNIFDTFQCTVSNGQVTFFL